MTLFEAISLFHKSERSWWIFHLIEIVFFIIFIISIIYLIFIIIKYKRKLYYLKNRDVITGAPSLYNFKRVAKKIIEANQNLNFVLIKLDIRQFALLNDIFGFEIGNNVLRVISDFFKQRFITPVRYYCQIVNDEFLILDSFTSENKEENKNRRDEFEHHVKKILEVYIKTYQIEFKIGRYYLEKGEVDIVSAIEKVNIAHRMAKRKISKPLHEYNDELKEQMVQGKIIESEVDTAFANDEFKIYLQPKVLLKNETIVAAEALVRWYKPDGKIISPNTFISIFERTGFIIRFDFYMLKKACQVIKKWQEEGKRIVPISVNFSKLHLLHEDFVDNIVKITKQMDVDSKYIEIEITESIFIDNPEFSAMVLTQLHDAGFVLAIDDFGTGYSSLGMMKNSHFDIVKIDKGFFDDETNIHRSNIVLKNVLKLIKELGLYSIAEGVETEQQVNNLRSLGCDMVQSYFYSKPVPAEEFDVDTIVKPKLKKML